MVFGLTLMTPAGMVGGLTHMVVHSILKILAFFCVGAILYKTHREYVYEINGFAEKCRLLWQPLRFLQSD